MLDLNEGARSYRCHLELATGRATLAYAEPHDSNDPGEEHKLATAETPFVGPGSHDLSFANVDDRLCLWIDGRLVDFGERASYLPYGGVLIQRPWDEDLIPVGVAARGADVTVSHLFLQRDIYYRGDFVYPGFEAIGQSAVPRRRRQLYGECTNTKGDPIELEAKVDKPAEWFREYERGLASRQTGPGSRHENVPFQFKMGKDEFFMMGDNSPRSKDSRLWSNARHALHRYAVPRIALVGKAFFIYWPHGIPFLNRRAGLSRRARFDLEQLPHGSFVLQLRRRDGTGGDRYQLSRSCASRFIPISPACTASAELSGRHRGPCRPPATSRATRSGSGRTDMPLLECIGLVKDYPGKRAVDDVDFHVERGEIVGLLGPNGAGKTTSFRMACGLIALTKGTVRLGGKDVTHWPMYKRARSGMGYLPQDNSIFRKLSVEQNVSAILEYLNVSRKERKQQIDRLLGQFGLDNKRRQIASTLSGGERRRLEIARCLASKPALILLDEPFTGIDPVTIHSIQDIIADLCQSGISILLTDHRERETLAITHRNYIICQRQSDRQRRRRDRAPRPQRDAGILRRAVRRRLDHRRQRGVRDGRRDASRRDRLQAGRSRRRIQRRRQRQRERNEPGGLSRAA